MVALCCCSHLRSVVATMLVSGCCWIPNSHEPQQPWPIVRDGGASSPVISGEYHVGYWCLWVKARGPGLLLFDLSVWSFLGGKFEILINFSVTNFHSFPNTFVCSISTSESIAGVRCEFISETSVNIYPTASVGNMRENMLDRVLKPFPLEDTRWLPTSYCFQS